MRTLAIIPARGGSKSIPKKNIRTVGGKPLLVYSIGHGLASECIDRVIVSTDSEEIAAIARNYGAEVPFIRPSVLAEDYSLDIDFYVHTLDWLREHEGYVPDMVVNLRPTTPVRDSKVLDDAIRLFEKHPKVDSMRAVRLVDKTPYKMWRKTKAGLIEPLFTSYGEFDEPYNMPRQLLPDVFVQDGYFDITWTSTIVEKNSVTGESVIPYEVPGVAIDIDYESDMEKAATLL